MRSLHPIPLFALAASACSTAQVEDPPAALRCAESCYVVATAVSDEDGANTYVKVIDHVDQGELDLSDAREFPGWSDMRVVGGKVFVSSGEEPIVYRFSVSDDGSLVEDGQLHFGNYSSMAAMYLHAFVADDKAYMFGDAGEYVVWNPTTLEITGTIPLPELTERDGYPWSPAYDTGMIVRDGRLYHTVGFMDYDTLEMSATSAIVVTDVATDTVVDVLDADCPYLNFASQGPTGDLYFSNWVYSPAATLLYDAAPACMVTIPAGATTLDPAPFVFADVTGGYEAAALTMLEDGDALLSVFVDDNAAFDPQTDDVYAWIFGANWKSYRLDLAGGELTELPELGWHSGGYYTANFDDKDYVLLPGANYDSTVIYELGADGAVPVTTTAGWSTRLYRVR